MEISGKTALYCLIGDPVDHSLSPFIMNRAFASNGIDGVYVAICVRAKHAVDAVRGLRTLGFAGANVTFPLKERVLDAVGRPSPDVEAIGAANVLRFSDEGVEAHNTDAAGTARALDVLGGANPAGKRVLVLGAGGSGRAAAYGVLEAGASAVVFAVRSRQKTEPVLKRLRNVFEGRPIEAFELGDKPDPGDIAPALAEADIIINATPAGMAGSGVRTLVDGRSGLSPRHCCFDFVYHPRETEFLRASSHAGAATIDGLALLVAQAAEAHRLWTGKIFSITDMYETVSARVGSELKT